MLLMSKSSCLFHDVQWFTKLLLLTARLQRGVCNIVDMTQFGFVLADKSLIMHARLLGSLKGIIGLPFVLGACSRLICLSPMTPLSIRS